MKPVKGGFKRRIALLVALVVLFAMNMPLALAQDGSISELVENMTSALDKLTRLNYAEIQDLVALMQEYRVLDPNDLSCVLDEAEVNNLNAIFVTQIKIDDAKNIIENLSAQDVQEIRNEVAANSFSLSGKTIEVVGDLYDLTEETRAALEEKYDQDITINDIADAANKLLSMPTRQSLNDPGAIFNDILHALEQSRLVKGPDSGDVGKIPSADLEAYGFTSQNLSELHEKIKGDLTRATMVRRVLLRTGYYKPVFDVADKPGIEGLFKIDFGPGVAPGGTIGIASSSVRSSSTLRFLTSGLKLTFSEQPAAALTLKLWVRSPFNFSRVDWSNVGLYKKESNTWALVSGSSTIADGANYITSGSISASGEYAVAEKVRTSGGGGGAAPAPAEPPAETIGEEDIVITEEPEVVYSAPEGTQTVSLAPETIQKLVENGKDIVIKTDLGTFKIPAEALEGLEPNQSVTLSLKEVEPDEAGEITSGLPEEYKPVGGVVDLTGSLEEDGDTAPLALSKPMKVTLSYTGADLEGVDEDKLGVYYYNETTKQWEYMGGKVNKEAKTIEFETTHTSKYAVMVYNKTFEDIANHWAKADIELMASKHIVKGVSDSIFEPERGITRAEFAALLVRTLGLKYNDGMAVPFEDVRAEDWFYKDVAVAYNAGLIKGASSTLFLPAPEINREQMAAMISRALVYAGKGITLTEAEVNEKLARFADILSISAWAKAEVASAVESGIIKGRTSDLLMPSATATRAESATMIRRMFDKVQ